MQKSDPPNATQVESQIMTAVCMVARAHAPQLVTLWQRRGAEFEREVSRCGETIPSAYRAMFERELRKAVLEVSAPAGRA
jgi:hypothetical protein